MRRCAIASGFQIIGLNNVIADLTTAAATIQVRSNRVTEASARRVEETAKALVPVRSGATRASIHTTMVDDQTAEVGPTTKQGFFMEYGTYKDAPQAYLGPALDRHSGDYYIALGLQAGLV